MSVTLTPLLLKKLREDPLYNINRSLYFENALREKVKMKTIESSKDVVR